jgi:hypothetical protein
LGVAISGLMAPGPMELFLVEAAAVLYGGWLWVMILACYGLAVLFIALMLRPRLVIYNVTSEQLLPALEEALGRLDPKFRWVGNCVVSEELGVSLHVEPLPVVKNVQLISAGPRQSLAGWRRLAVDLSAALQKAPGTPNPYGASLLSIGLLIAGIITWLMADDPSSVQQALADMLRQSS